MKGRRRREVYCEHKCVDPLLSNKVNFLAPYTYLCVARTSARVVSRGTGINSQLEELS